MSSYTDADYLRWNPFDGADRDVDIRARTVKVVTTKAPHLCYGEDGAASSHDMPAGTRARVERAIVDGEWGSYYICTACMDRWLKDRDIRPMESTARGKGEGRATTAWLIERGSPAELYEEDGLIFPNGTAKTIGGE